MRKYCLLFLVFFLLQAIGAVESPKHEIRAVWLTTIYGLDWPKKPATTGEKSTATGIMFYAG